jgi:hypothetical protein
MSNKRPPKKLNLSKSTLQNMSLEKAAGGTTIKLFSYSHCACPWTGYTACGGCTANCTNASQCC